jgi:hypothetical protein
MMHAFDLAGFDPENDEESYFEAELVMEAGMFDRADADDRERIQAQFGIRDAQHWHIVKQSVWEVLAQKHGSFDEATQRMFEFRSQRVTVGRVEASTASRAFEN